MKVDIAASPYANIYGEIEIPNNLGTADEIEMFITQHFDEIKWGDPQIDFRGTDMTYICEDKGLKFESWEV